MWTVLIIGTLFITKYANDVAQDTRPHGATFRILLPRHIPEPVVEPQKKAVEAKPAADHTGRGAITR